MKAKTTITLSDGKVINSISEGKWLPHLIEYSISDAYDQFYDYTEDSEQYNLEVVKIESIAE